MTDDVIDRPTIPDTVRDKLQAFRDIAGDRRVSLLQNAADRQAAFMARDRAETRLQELRRGGLRDDDHPVTSPLLEDIKRHDATIVRLSARAEQATPAWEQVNRLVTQLEAYVSQHATRVAVYDGAVPSLQDGETAHAAMQRSADRVRSLKAGRLQTLAAPFPAKVAKEIAWQQLTARAEAAAPDYGALIDALEPIRFPADKVSIAGRATAFDVVDPIGWLTLVFPIEMRKFSDRQVDAISDDKIALSAEQRKAKLAIIDADLLAAERDEVHFAVAADLIPRSDADARAVLMLSDTMPPPARED